jgi:hypothetical protein
MRAKKSGFGLVLLAAIGCGGASKKAEAPAQKPEPGHMESFDYEEAPRAPPTLEEMLDQPRLLGISLGDQSGYVTRALGVKAKDARCPNESALERDESDTWYCWKKTKLRGATEVRAGFTEGRNTLLLYALEVEYPLTETDRVFKELTREPALSTYFVEVKAGVAEWDWGHARVTLDEGKDVLHLSVRSLLEAPAPRSRFSQIRNITPWGIELGHDSKKSAEDKLASAGFTQGTACVSLTPPASKVQVESCGFENAGVTGLKYSKLELTSIGGEPARVSQLECVYEPMMVDVVRRELRDRYGEPMKGSPKDAPTWWTVPAGIFYVSAGDYLAANYQHGRLHKIAELAVKAGGY